MSGSTDVFERKRRLPATPAADVFERKRKLPATPAADVFERKRKLPHQLREQIMKLCSRGDLTVSEIEGATGASAAKVRWALQRLRKDGVVEMRGTARGAYYRVCRAAAAQAGASK